ncbi:MAG TPA: putative sulfate exporter family transporter [Humidesulfovibrio sp.]|uniref:putative sulfate exporter family transporter n=1 Tax=Humidesulfovibrio sp. TaxID=2910988 RepID=UPI002B6949DF|nr:putative sulfate exporter family transporter [Humidesulfovibrio sp.]HWR02582.1 putative sulfate exporter family transporter [Humidesulfovibrio sp.]
MAEQKRWLTEDKLALIMGLFLFMLGMLTFAGVDALGWAVKTNVWVTADKIFGAATGTYKGLPGYAALLITFVFITTFLSVGVKFLGGDVPKFIKSFTLVFFISIACYAAGHYAQIAATPDKVEKLGIPWSLGLTGEAGFIIALLAGIFFGNITPGFADKMKEALRPEMYIKIAIVILGAELGVKAVDALGLASSVIFRGLCAIVEAYLIYWALVYYVARKHFKFSREWAAPLASGISICGVSASIATGGAIRARPVVPIMVSSLVVVFTCIEMLILPFAAQYFLSGDPMVAGAWMGLAVKSDGGAIASGAIADALIRAKVFADTGVMYQEGWVTMTATTIKIFIDVFIGIWSFILAVVWCKYIDCKPGERMKFSAVLDRFPRFVLGYVITFLIMLALCATGPDLLKFGKSTIASTNVFRGIFFLLTFFTIGLVSNFKKLWAEGIGRLAAVYVVCLFGFIIWIGLFISWLFFHGMKPPVV